MAARRPAIRPTPVIVALLAALAASAAFGASSALIPMIKLNAFVLTFALIGVYLTHAGLQRGFFTNLGVALVSAALGVFTMWAVWVALEYSPQTLIALLQQGPKGVIGFLDHLSHTTIVSIRGSAGSTWTYGPDEVRLAWIAETAAVALAPVLGALWSPIARRQMAAARA